MTGKALMVLPVHNPIDYPDELDGQENGRLPVALLWPTPGQAGGPTVNLVEPAARAWRAMTAAALAAGHTLKATSPADSYRSYERQVATFVARYEPDPFPGFIATRWWPRHQDSQGRWVAAHLWYQKPNTAVAAAPGSSNHGWGLAVDIGEERDGDAGTESIDAATLNWLIANAHLYGFSAEVQSEPWHWRRYSGDVLEPAVLAYEEADLTPEQDRLLYNLDRIATALLFQTPKITGVKFSDGTLHDFPNYLLSPFAAKLVEGVPPPVGLSEQQVEDAAFRGAQRAEDE